MTENVPYPMPITVVRGVVTVTEGDGPPRAVDVYAAMPATTPTDTVLMVFGEELRRKAALAAGLDELDNWPTTEEPR